jgi:Putative abortive phage resistance protein AbiGi, antitoxin
MTYISPYLTHFVGRSLHTDEDRYRLLLTILEHGLLRAPDWSDATTRYHEGGRVIHTMRRRSQINYSRALSRHDKYLSAAVCFCDIPLDDLAVHTTKYGRFGLSFPKAFLVRRGASPVFYVAGTSPTHEIAPPECQHQGHQVLPRAELFDMAEKEYADHIVRPGEPVSSPVGSVPSRDPLVRFKAFANDYLFPFLKFFDPEKADDDPENYYTEREWRVLGVVVFGTTDIARVVIPGAFRDRIIRDAGIAPDTILSLPG